MTNPEDSAPKNSGRPDAKDAMKAKFREALEKKKGRHHASAKGAERDGSSKSHGANGPVEAREFRRKSG